MHKYISRDDFFLFCLVLRSCRWCSGWERASHIQISDPGLYSVVCHETDLLIYANICSQCQFQWHCYYLYSAPSVKLASALDGLAPGDEKCFSWKQLRWRSGRGQDLEDCSRWTDQQWQKPVGGRMCRVGDVVRAVDFAQRNRDVCGCTVGHSERRGIEVPDCSGIDGPWPPAWTLLILRRQPSGAREITPSVWEQFFTLFGCFTVSVFRYCINST